jgi:prepilin-type N-terminal cleavage/methylation domain-containing protein/prepilin-type processing-associated H-X9-DG protein
MSFRASIRRITSENTFASTALLKEGVNMKTEYSFNSKSNGFTLIELLVVIAIIAILASILFPVFARARENARRTSCLSNMKQMGLAVEQYKQDYDGYYPYARGATGYWYVNYLEPYVKSTQVTKCPSAPSKWEVNYSYNLAFGYAPDANGAAEAQCGFLHPIRTGLNESRVTEVSKSIVISESSLMYYMWKGHFGIGDPFEMTYLDVLYPYYVSDAVVTLNPAAGLHLDGVNNVYADGHAKWQKLTYLNADANKKQWCAITE